MRLSIPAGWLVVCLSLSLSLSACGFHLRGSAQIPPQWNPIYIEAEELQPQQLAAVRSALTRASARLSTQRQSSSRLFISIQPMQSRRLAGSSSSGIELRQLSMQLEYSLQNQHGETLIDTQGITQNTEIELDSSNVLTHQDQLEAAADRLEKNLIHSLVFRLSHH